MRVIGYAALAVLAMAAIVAAQTGDDKVVQEASKAGETAGAAAGATAGAAAGKAAAEQAASMQAFAAEVSNDDFAYFEKKDPGAVAFFKDHDTDNDKHLSKAEWMELVQSSKGNGFLDSEFDGLAQWESFPKNEELKLNLRDFLAWASKTPSKEVNPAEASGNKTALAEQQAQNKAAHCGELFKRSDGDANGGLDLAEFKSAVAGQLDLDQIEDTFARLDHNGPGKSMTLDTFAPFCSRLTGLPKDADDVGQAAVDKQDPCSENPCAKQVGTVCVADPKQCVKEPCPQYKCINKANDDSNVAPAPSNEYGKCSVMFYNADRNKDKVLVLSEFVQGVTDNQKSGDMSSMFNVQTAWNHLDKLEVASGQPEQVNLKSWMHFCVAVLEEGTDDGSSAKEECWDVFTRFDADGSNDISQTEFNAGMRQAKRQGHLPADLDIDATWGSLKKTSADSLDVGTFIKFCLDVSRGDDPALAARMTQPPKQQLNAPVDAEYMSGSEYQASTQESSEETGDENNVGNSTAGTSNLFCATAFHKADANGDSRITSDEFKAICPTVVVATANVSCDNYAVLFKQFDSENSGWLSSIEFTRLCRTQGDNNKASDLNLDEEALEKLRIGAKAGAAAGAEAGRKAGTDAGREAGAKATNDLLSQQSKSEEGSTASFLESNVRVRKLVMDW